MLEFIDVETGMGLIIVFKSLKSFGAIGKNISATWTRSLLNKSKDISERKRILTLIARLLALLF
jgi:hypothetical protein